MLDNTLKCGDRVAYYWEGEPGDTQMLHIEIFMKEFVAINALKLDVVRAISCNLPWYDSEIVVSMLACARIGAVHSVVFGGFSSEALADRINDAEAKIVITADGVRRRRNSTTKDNVDSSLS